MNAQIQEIALRLRGLRDVMEITTDEMALICNVSYAEYLTYESGEQDIPMAALQNISRHFNFDLSALLFGSEPHLHSFFLTRAGLGTAMERTHTYKYQALASGFVGKKAAPFIVTVESKSDDYPLTLNSHEGQEFNYILEGSMLLSVDGHELILEEGDSLYFDSSKPHGMKALGNKPVKFLAFIV